MGQLICIRHIKVTGATHPAGNSIVLAQKRTDFQRDNNSGNFRRGRERERWLCKRRLTFHPLSSPAPLILPPSLWKSVGVSVGDIIASKRLKKERRQSRGGAKERREGTRGQFGTR